MAENASGVELSGEKLAKLRSGFWIDKDSPEIAKHLVSREEQQRMVLACLRVQKFESNSAADLKQELEKKLRDTMKILDLSRSPALMLSLESWLDKMYFRKPFAKHYKILTFKPYSALSHSAQRWAQKKIVDDLIRTFNRRSRLYREPWGALPDCCTSANPLRKLRSEIRREERILNNMIRRQQQWRDGMTSFFGETSKILLLAREVQRHRRAAVARDQNH